MEARLDHTQPHPAVKRPTWVELGAYELRKPHALMSYAALMPRLSNHDDFETQHAARFDQSKPGLDGDGSNFGFGVYHAMSIHGMWPQLCAIPYRTYLSIIS
jgi:hypothetical protein